MLLPCARGELRVNRKCPQQARRDGFGSCGLVRFADGNRFLEVYFRKSARCGVKLVDQPAASSALRHGPRPMGAMKLSRSKEPALLADGDFEPALCDIASCT
ncbi:hypothetical protein F2981_22260 (plasmid) [Sinorhizobium meliloti]|nr:hypothetical protein [Sinorhizobium meliloti]